MSAAVVAPSGTAATATPLKGGAVLLSPASVGGRRRRMSKKTRKMLRALRKMKGGEVENVIEAADSSPEEAPLSEEMGGRRRRRRSRRSRRTRRSRAGLFA